MLQILPLSNHKFTTQQTSTMLLGLDAVRLQFQRAAVSLKLAFARRPCFEKVIDTQKSSNELVCGHPK